MAFLATMVGMLTGAPEPGGPFAPWAERMSSRTAPVSLRSRYLAHVRRPMEHCGYTLWAGQETDKGYLNEVGDPKVLESETDFEELARTTADLVVFSAIYNPRRPAEPLEADGSNLDFARYEVTHTQTFPAFERLGLKYGVYLGPATNGLFPIFPKWYFDTLPDAAQLDQHGKPFVANHEFFGPGLESLWASHDHPAFVRSATESVAYHANLWKDNPGLQWWGVCGELLHAEACYQGQGRHGDYSRYSLAHFRAWCEERYGAIGKLNEAWGTQYAGFEEAEPPREAGRDRRSLDWLNFRVAQITEVYRWSTETLKRTDPTRLALGLHHGHVTYGDTYRAMGISPWGVADVTDGIASSQISWPGVQEFHNDLMATLLSSFGKPFSCPFYGMEQDLATFDITTYGKPNYIGHRARRSLYEFLLHGTWNEAVGVWNGWGWTLKNNDIRRTVEQVYGEMRALSPEIDFMSPWRPRTAVYVSEARWLLDGWAPACTAWHVESNRRQLPYHFLFDSSVSRGDLDEYECVISIDNDAVEPDAAERLERYVRKGGRLLVIETAEAHTPLGFLECARTGQPFAVGDGQALVWRGNLFGQPVHERGAALSALFGFVDPEGRATPLRVEARVTDTFSRDGESLGLPASDQITAGLLTDGLTHACVLINRYERGVRGQVTLLPELLPCGDYRARVLGAEDAPAQSFKSGEAISFELPAYGTAVIYVAPAQIPAVTAEDLEGLVNATRARQEAGFDVSAVEALLEGARACDAEPHAAKRAALLLRARNTLVVKAEVSQAKELTVTVTDLEGRPMEQGEVTVSIPALYGHATLCRPAGAGRYTCRASPAELPRVYDFDRQAFRPHEGPLALDIDAREGTRSGGMTFWMD